MKFLQNSSQAFLNVRCLVAATDRYDFEFTIYAAERKRRIEDSSHKQEIKITLTKIFQSHFKVIFEQ